MNKTRILFRRAKKHLLIPRIKMERRHLRYLLFTLAACGILMAQNAHAFTVPAAGSFAYDLYDLAVNQLLKGPVGFVAGVGFILLCVFATARQLILPAILCLFAGVILIKADSIVTTLGCLIS